MTDLMPAIFFGHGNPMNTVERNVYTKGWAAMETALGRPKAVLSVSAHWYIPACAATANVAPPTIHDFGGFPDELYKIQYPAPGSPDLARRVKDLLAPVSVRLDGDRGLDHGTWSVLRHVLPDADVPVIQLSIDERQPASFHYEMGKRLAILREEGVLVMGSGNLVHNLYAYDWDRSGVEPFDWALRFEQRVRDLLLAADDGPLVAYETLGRDANLSIPTPDHYLPLLYVIGLRKGGEKVSFPVEGIEGGSVSMLTVQVGG